MTQMSSKTSRKDPVAVFDPGLCRCCGAMTECRVLNEMYEDMGRKEVYSDMIMNCFGLELSNLYGKPMDRLVCTQCVNKLRQALSFKIQVMQSEEAFLQSKMYNSHTDCKIRLKCSAELGVQQTLLRSVNPDTAELRNCDVEEGGDMMSDGLDDEIGPELLDEYYSLLQESRGVDGWSDDELPTASIDTGHRKPASEPVVGKETLKCSDLLTEQDQPFMQAANASYIVKYSFVCPFRNRFNHILCYYCDQYFLDPVLLRKHTLTHNPEKDFRAIRHRFIKLDVTRIDCRLCTRKINDLEDFKRHLLMAHEKHYFVECKDCVLPFKLVENFNKCVLCNEEFSHFVGLIRHMNKHFSNYVCETCGMGFMDEISLQTHARAHDSRRYPCKTCKKTFKSEYTRLCHKRRIHEKDVTGSFCTKCDAYLLREQKTKHMVEVHGESPTVPCLGCDQVFRSRQLLTIHVRREHMKDFRYECHVCHKKFFRRTSLNLHMPTHTGERNFKCKVCEKRYPRLKTLKEHMKIHNNDRRYRCGICGQAFVQKCSLKGHMKNKHPE